MFADLLQDIHIKMTLDIRTTKVLQLLIQESSGEGVGMAQDRKALALRNRLIARHRIQRCVVQLFFLSRGSDLSIIHAQK